ncbi:hypothetical protein U9M48_030409 [Paspalum notatum var. saurae]|uniref:Uncharacterized protein n=1 Tax=Paspalum notatum var. saurae TaxID=547442 RepID=A0AAQ3X379_PASNO
MLTTGGGGEGGERTLRQAWILSPFQTSPRALDWILRLIQEASKKDYGSHTCKQLQASPAFALDAHRRRHIACVAGLLPAAVTWPVWLASTAVVPSQPGPRSPHAHPWALAAGLAPARSGSRPPRAVALTPALPVQTLTGPDPSHRALPASHRSVEGESFSKNEGYYGAFTYRWLFVSFYEHYIQNNISLKAENLILSVLITEVRGLSSLCLQLSKEREEKQPILQASHLHILITAVGPTTFCIADNICNNIIESLSQSAAHTVIDFVLGLSYLGHRVLQMLSIFVSPCNVSF